MTPVEQERRKEDRNFSFTGSEMLRSRVVLFESIVQSQEK
jgi:hypothetical protein